MGPVCIEGESMSDAGWEAKFKECQVYSGPPQWPYSCMRIPKTALCVVELDPL